MRASERRPRMSVPDPSRSGVALSRGQIKFVLRAGLVVAMLIVGVAAISLLGRSMASITRSDETDAIFNVAAALDDDLVDAVTWLPDPDGLPRPLPTIEREAITETWLRGWSQLLILSDGAGEGEGSIAAEAVTGLETYFDQAGGTAVVAGAAGWQGLPVHQISHDLRLNFYSDDGTVASVTAEQSRLLRALPVGDTIEWFDATESFEAVLVLRDGNWRIHHLVRTSADGNWISAPAPSRVALAGGGLRSVTWVPTTQSVDEFWSEPDLAAFSRDAAAIAALGFSGLRLELPFEEMGGRDVTTVAVETLTSALSRADQAGLAVTLSVFDGRVEHQPARWDADDEHLRQLVAAVGEHPALAMWELAHAPDQDIGIERVDASLLHAWLVHSSRTLRANDRDTPITVGWSTARAAAEAPPIADVISFAYPGSAGALQDGVQEIRSVHTALPVVVTDVSSSTDLGILPGGATETEQARYFADALLAADQVGLQGLTVSSLRDAPATSDTHGTAGTGLLRADGTAKPAAALFGPGFDLDTVPVPGLADKLSKPFNALALALLGFFSAGWLVMIIWARRGRQVLPTQVSKDPIRRQLALPRPTMSRPQFFGRLSSWLTKPLDS